MSARELLEAELQQREAASAEVVESSAAETAASQRRKQNVRICLYLYFARAVQASVATRDFLDVYLFELSGSNEFVGKVESTRGIASLLMLAPCGFIIDRYDRQRILRNLAALKSLTVVACAVAVSYDSLSLLWPALVFRKMVEGPFDQVLQVVLVDNVLEPERRTHILSQKEILTWSGTAVGPLLALLLILAHAGTGASVGEGSDYVGWSLQLLRTIIQVGLLSFFVVEPVVLLLRSADDDSNCQHGNAQSVTGRAGEPPAWTEAKVCGVRKRWLIPIWTDVIWAGTQVAGSMSLTYFSLFFRNDFGMTPSMLMLLRFLENASLALMNSATPKMTARLGRGWAAVIFIAGGAALIVALTLVRDVWIIAILFVLRTAVARANVPCTQSIIYECVAARHRGKWTAITSFTAASNGAGAWIGGYLADRTGDYRAAFKLTGIIQGTCAVLLAPVAMWLPPET